MKIGILGGDYRYKFIYEMFREENISVKIFNNSFVDNNVNNLDELLDNLDILVGPIPFSKDNKSIFFSDTKITNEILIDELMKKLENIKKCHLLAGTISNDVKDTYNVKIFDFFEQESIAILNAIPTAEGAIQTAMEQSLKTIFGSNILVLGYGRCGKILSNMLKGIGANVSATYLNSTEYSYIKSYAISPVPIDSLENVISNFDFIFNTVPACILDSKILKNLNQESIIIDIAQAPGGLDYKYARDKNIKAIYCPGLPARVAPFTAGKIIKESIEEYYKNNF